HHPSSPPAIHHSFCHPAPVDQPPPADPLAHQKSLAEHAITRAPIEKKYRDINLSYREINARGWFL
ncbi:hypothetical protein NC652_037141, partial [Populus alba x Populus x berolinensis]